MSINSEQEAVLRDEINLMMALEKVTSDFNATTPLGGTICQSWRNTFVHYKEANAEAIKGSQADFDAALDTEQEQLRAFLPVIRKDSPDAQSWNDFFAKDIDIVSELRNCNP